MTTDDRLDRLTERHEALTQSVEMLTLDVRELKEAALSLLEIARIHETRISRLEGNQTEI
jgi:hypothetical protein